MVLRRSLNLVAVAALVSVGVAVVVLGQASAHSPYIVTSCETGEAQGETSLKAYHGTNEVQIWVDGVSVVDTTFEHDYHNLSALGDPNVKHTYRVRVVAQDDEDFKDGWSVDRTKESDHCEPESTSSTHPPVKIVICEETSNPAHPHRPMTVDEDSIEMTDGHDGHSHDIIPPFTGYPGKNWDSSDREIYDNDCKDMDHESTTTSGPEVSAPPTSGPKNSVPYTSVPYTSVPASSTTSTSVPGSTSPTVVQDSGTPVTTVPPSTTTSPATTTTVRASEAPTTTTAVTTTIPGDLPTSGGSPGPTLVLGAFGVLLGLGLILLARIRRLVAVVPE